MVCKDCKLFTWFLVGGACSHCEWKEFTRGYFSACLMFEAREEDEEDEEDENHDPAVSALIRNIRERR